jgi:hypothetical protein
MGITRPRRSRDAIRGVVSVPPLALLALLLASVAQAQDSLEYQVKAVYLFNFVKFVSWPPAPASAPITICVAERNPFGESLQEAIRGEVVGDRRLEARVVAEPQPGCSVVFIPQGTDAKPYLEAARGSHTLTVGEERGFIGRGGIVNFILDGGSVRFEIDAAAAERAKLRISSHLMRLARGRAPATL